MQFDVIMSGTDENQDALFGSSRRKSDYFGSAIGMNVEQLRARLYATSEIHTSSRPQLKVSRRRSNTAEVNPSI